MSLKRPMILKALSRPVTIFGMHSIATLVNAIMITVVGFFTPVLFGFILFAALQIFIAVLTRRDRYFAEVFYKKLEVGRTRNLNLTRKGNYYAV